MSAVESTPVILASASPSRADLLRQAGVTFSVQPAALDETPIKNAQKAAGASALDAATLLAEQKAVAVSKTMSGAWVIGADSILDLDGQWFDKPADIDQARDHLRTLRGRTHSLATASVVARDGQRVWHTEDTPVLTMRSFSDSFLDGYLSACGDAILSSVGAYHLEGLGAQLFDKIEGSFFSILGLPLLPVLDFLRRNGALAT